MGVNSDVLPVGRLKELINQRNFPELLGVFESVHCSFGRSGYEYWHFFGRGIVDRGEFRYGKTYVVYLPLTELPVSNEGSKNE